MTGPANGSGRVVQSNSEVLDLPDVPDSDQRVSAPDGVIEECERLVLGQGQQPERQLCHLGSERVLIHAIQAPLGYDAVGVGQPLVRVLGDQLFAGCSGRCRSLWSDSRYAGVPLLGVLPRLDAAARTDSGQAWTKNAPEPQAISQILRSSSSLALRSFHSSFGFPSAGPM